MDSFYDTKEWKLGDASQKRYAKLKASEGACVLPVYGMDSVDSKTKAPVMFVGDGVLVVPDLCVIRGGKTQFHEVKAKSEPSWRRTHRRWEHGCDYSLAIEYRNIQKSSGSPVFIVVHEVASPVNPNAESRLVDSDLWIAISIGKAFEVGEHRKTWPGGTRNPRDRGRRGMGGLLWDRNQMKQLKVGISQVPCK